MNTTQTETRFAPNLPGLLQDKAAIITGASRGIGAAAARAFAQPGAHLVMAARDEQALDSVPHALLAAQAQALVVPTDVADPGSVEHLVRQTLDTYGRLDPVSKNAGDGHMPSPLAGISVDAFDRVLRVNLRGVLPVTCPIRQAPVLLPTRAAARCRPPARSP